MNKQPEQTALTRAKLMDAFWKLFRQQGMGGITVGAVTREAGYNRGTFYEYFSDLDDLLAQLEDDLIGEMRSAALASLVEEPLSDLHDFSLRTAVIFVPHREEIFTLLGENGDPKFVARAFAAIKPLMLSVLGIDENDPRTEYLMAYAFNAMLGLISCWYAHGCDLPDEEYLELAQSLIATGIQGYLGKTLFAKSGIPGTGSAGNAACKTQAAAGGTGCPASAPAV